MRRALPRAGSARRVFRAAAGAGPACGCEPVALRGRRCAEDGQGRPLGAGLSARLCSGGGPAARRRGHFPSLTPETRGRSSAAERKPAFRRAQAAASGGRAEALGGGRCRQLGSEAAAFPTAKLKGTVFPGPLYTGEKLLSYNDSPPFSICPGTEKRI